MLDVLSAIGVAAFGLVSLAVGARLLLLAARTHAIPELAIGTGFVVGVLLGFVPETLLYSTDLVPEPWVRPLTRLAEISIRVCAVAILVFTWRVFAPDALYARVVVAGLALVMIATHVMAPYGAHHAETVAERVWVQWSFVARTAALLWGTFEAMRYWAASRRRVAIGLTDPVISNRFLLWGVAMGAASFIMGSMLLAPVFGLAASDIRWLLVESAFGSLAAFAIWLTFFPPKAYLAWLGTGHEQTAPA